MANQGQDLLEHLPRDRHLGGRASAHPYPLHPRSAISASINRGMREQTPSRASSLYGAFELTQPTPMKKTIWSCWFQGREAAPHLVKRCFSSWERENPGWHFRCLDAVSIERYVNLKGIVDLQSQSLTAASFSDFVRILLLHEFGGIWVDATVLGCHVQYRKLICEICS